uniref:Uncharacterized protein n=1 Tax=Macrostomum lignano TaxID=282301 RepID=A0A1I8FPI1_9PLAT
MPAAPSTIQETDMKPKSTAWKDPMRCPPDTDATLHEACSALLTVSQINWLKLILTRKLKMNEATVSAEAAAPSETTTGAHLQQQKRQQLAADSQTSSSPPGLG